MPVAMFCGCNCWASLPREAALSPVFDDEPPSINDVGLVAALPTSSLSPIMSAPPRAVPAACPSPCVQNDAAVDAAAPASPTPGTSRTGDTGVSGMESAAAVDAPSQPAITSAARF